MFPVFFPDKMKMSNLLHIGLILIISNVFTILSAYFAGVGIGNTVVTFKTKQSSVSCCFKWVPKWDGSEMEGLSEVEKKHKFIL